jgi:hypothetical protein
MAYKLLHGDDPSEGIRFIVIGARTKPQYDGRAIF